MDIYYEIVPVSDAISDHISNVKIIIYEGESDTVVAELNGQTDDASGKYLTGGGLHVTWTAPLDPSSGFYRVQLQVFIGVGSEPLIETPIGDADSTTPLWQCPQDCLAVHDLLYKHRPVLNIASGEIAQPCNADFMLARAGLWYAVFDLDIHDYLPMPVLPQLESLDDLSQEYYNNSDYYFKYFNESDRTSPPSHPFAVYHASFPDENHVFMQYWFFTPTSYLPSEAAINNWHHEGDWEMMQFTVKLVDTDDSSKKTNWIVPWAATAMQHYYGQTLKWRQDPEDNLPTSQDQDYIEKSGYQPVMYIAHLSHAFYFRDGEFEAWPGSHPNPQFQYHPATYNLYADKTPAASVINISSSDFISLKGNPAINKWEGYWGDQHPLSGIIIANGQGPPSPWYRGEAEREGTNIAQQDPKGFHNSFLKSFNESTQATEYNIP